MSKFMWLGIALVIAGITSGFLEQVFYGGRLDENNVVQDSFFLPLAFILMFLGVVARTSGKLILGAVCSLQDVINATQVQR